jgi:hypothetical protein
MGACKNMMPSEAMGGREVDPASCCFGPANDMHLRLESRPAYVTANKLLILSSWLMPVPDLVLGR